MRKCAGCDAEFEPGPRERNPRRWCSQACRNRFARRPAIATMACVVCGGAFPARRGKKYCGDQCRWATPEKKARSATRKRRMTGATVELVVLPVLATRDSCKCGLCGKKVNLDLSYPHPMSPSVDHVVPLSCGGEHSYKNTQLAHLSCNLRKKTKAMGEQLRLIG